MLKKYEYILTYNSVNTTLTVNPANWDKIGVNFIRHEVYHSILRNFTMSVRFAKITGGGTDVILNAYATEGIKADVRITINKRNPRTNGFELFYQGSLDFKTMVIERDFIEITIMDGMKVQKLISRDEINFDVFKTVSADNISLTDFSSQKSIALTPIDIILEGSFEGDLTESSIDAGVLTAALQEYKDCFKVSNQILNEFGSRISFSAQFRGIFNSLAELNTQIPTGNTNDEAFINNGTYFDVYYWDDAWLVGSVSKDPVVYTNSTQSSIVLDIVASGVFSTQIDFRVSGNPGVLCISLTQIEYAFIVYDSDSNQIDIKYLFPISFANQSTINNDDQHFVLSDIPVSLSDSITVPVNGYVELCVKYTQQVLSGNGSLEVYVFTPDLKINTLNFSLVENSTGQAETNARCLFPHEAFTRLVQMTTSETDTSKLFYSGFFGKTDSEFQSYGEIGDGAYDAITNGRLIRQYPNQALNLNLRHLFQTFDAIYNLGLGYDRINDRFYIEQKTAFYDNSYLMFDLGEVAGLKIMPAMDEYFSKITGGYENEGDYEEYQGAYEFNVKREYSISPPVKEEKIIQGKYNLDSIGIELTRRKQYSSNASLDTRFDQNTYIIRTDGTSPVLSSNVTGFAGIEMYYNTMLTPRQNMLRWSNVLRAALYKNGDPVKYQNSSKVVSMIYDSTNEFSDIQQAELNTALFRPEFYEFESYINTEILSILNNNPHGYVRFSYESEIYEGYLESIETGDYNKKATYKLLAKEISTGNDFLLESALTLQLESFNNLIYD